MYELRKADYNATIHAWIPFEEIEKGAMEQLDNVARHPEVGDIVAVMPDVHVGYGVPIGCVFPTVDAVVPNAVGVDIGCGMCAINTGVTYDPERMDQRFWRAWSGQVARDVPTGFNSHKTPQPLGHLDRRLRATNLQHLLNNRAAYQLGTLGGGNHFMEAQIDEQGSIWLMVHSGSRHTGLQIANHYNKLAIQSTERRRLQVGKDLASLPLDDPIGQDYLHDMQWATDFALANREQMLANMHRAFADAVGDRDTVIDPASDPSFINIHHNFANIEEHGGRDVVVHRKGATSAFKDQMGIIPGSMGATSYIVRGLGNEQALKSCSHGAGRRMGRKAARRAITAEEFATSLAGTHSRARMGYVDEAPDAYKDIEEVIARQADLVDVVHTLRPLMTVKGDSRARDD